jgi:hypothetical protein
VLAAARRTRGRPWARTQGSLTIKEDGIDKSIGGISQARRRLPANGEVHA